MPMLRAFPKDLGFIIILFIILFVVIPFLILYFLRLPNGLISTLIYFQLIIIWIQAEISLRQQELYESQALPIIVLHSSNKAIESKSMEEGKATERIGFTVKNVSKNPAFNIILTRILSRDHTPINPDVWIPLIQRDVIEDLEPGEEKELFSIDWDDLEKLMEKQNAGVFEVGFMDRYGGFHSSLFMVYLKNGSLGILPIVGEELRERGFLLPMLNRIYLLLSYYKYRRRLQRLGKKKQNSV